MEGEDVTYNLASEMLLRRYAPFTLKEIKEEIAASKSQNFEVDARSYSEHTALMFACSRGDKKVIKFLLDKGADPNAQCEMGNTPMHYAISNVGLHCPCNLKSGTCAYGLRHYPDRCNTKTKLEIVKLLLSRGAVLKANGNGQDPACVAAMETRSQIVDFFVQKNNRSVKLSVAEKVRALQTLGVATVLEPLRGYQEDNIIDSFRHFYNAQLMLEKAGNTREASNTREGGKEKSDLASAFSLLSQKPYNSAEWKKIQKKDFAIRTQALVVAERVLPESIRWEYLFPRLLYHARLGIFRFGNIKDRRLQGIQILQEAMKLEETEELEVTTVLRNIIHGFHMSSWEYLQLQDNVKDCFPLMDTCLEGIGRASEDDVHAVHRKVLYNLGTLLLHLALETCSKTIEIFHWLLQFAERTVQAIQKKSEGQRVTSITHYILHKAEVLNLVQEDQSECLIRVKHLISRLLKYEDATHITVTGDTMLHTLMKNGRFGANPQFLKDVTRILIRHGCDISEVNDDGLTVEEQLREEPLKSNCEDIVEMVSVPSSVLPLEEIAIRAVLRHKIPFEGIVPRHLSGLITGDIQPDSKYQSAELSTEDSDSETDQWFSDSEDLSSDSYDMNKQPIDLYESNTDFSDFSGSEPVLLGVAPAHEEIES
ncbi:uncharacterized protein LOC121423367 [Lytechinus variegatus]|uniref:uncharacterized protein LOC121423367 n=1 Tax=Lytechinus variegatus TaxID=7654 RepID=UPI001BB1651A|nr:uncharacterized protein LOC121423367 [Lytechinus variegatus]